MYDYARHNLCGKLHAKCTCEVGGKQIGLDCFVCRKVLKKGEAGSSSLICSYTCHVRYVVEFEGLTDAEAVRVIDEEQASS